jgi:tRNA threonylcarbamoyladenosine biosynthesis protein TsaB
VLLAFDTATPLVTVALRQPDRDDGQDIVVELTAERPMKHAEQLAPLIERAMAEAGIVRQDLTAIAVGVGPGPFTGLRVGLVTARTLGFVLDIPVYGVCSLDVLAVEAVSTGAVSGEFVVATDARRKEVYLARYDAGGERLDGPLVDRPAAVATDAPAVGPGAELYPEAFPHRVGPTAPSAGWLARAVAEERVELRDPEPLYLRRPDAEAAHAPKRVS